MIEFGCLDSNLYLDYTNLEAPELVNAILQNDENVKYIECL